MSTDSIFDLSQALDRVDGDREIFAELAQLFIEQAPRELAAIRNALVQHNASAVARTAHRLKGSVLQLCASTLYNSVVRLEERGKAGDLQSAASLCELVDCQLQSLIDALRGLMEKGYSS